MNNIEPTIERELNKLSLRLYWEPKVPTTVKFRFMAHFWDYDDTIIAVIKNKMRYE